MADSLNFQSIILKLQEFWAAHGCLIWQPYYTQVGAGTMNPATFLRVLGPEPWNVAYVEPSVRPDDGRYGENPNRFQQHTQFQVILKPDPGNPVELYIQSLEVLGIDPRQHDIRLVEDNWEQPAISAWGLGWEIWLDGQEITQFTYFQQVGGQTLDPVSVEITYGLERILIALNDAPAIWDEPWSDTVTYGEVRHRDEFEHSKYYFEVGNVDRLRQMYELFEAEAKSCLDQGLLVPAHDYILKCSHTFNVMDTRGAIGVTERQAYFGRMRAMARKVAEAYTQQRMELEYPLLKDITQLTGMTKPSTSFENMKVGPQDFLLEIGVEELPVGDLNSAVDQLKRSVPEMLANFRLDYDEIVLDGTPRRLVVRIKNLADIQTDISEEIKGPPSSRAFDENGNPTKVAEGFARGKGVEVKDLLVKEIDGGSYVFAPVHQKGRPTAEVLMEYLPNLVAGIKFDRSMRWLPNPVSGSDIVSFSRPLRWFVALLGETIIPFEYANLVAGNQSVGLRPYDSPQILINSASSYPALMKMNGIILSVSERQNLIRSEVNRLADSVEASALLTDELLAEIANLVEKPTPFLCSFSSDYLSLPREVLISVMKKHQRYIPLEKNGKLLPYFIVVRNGDEQGLELVKSGNEHVVRARFADAGFFVQDDLKHSLEYFRSKLTMLTFHESLGSMLDKSDRIVKLAPILSSSLELEKEQSDHAVRAAYLSKADLATKIVVEMTSLQGIIGGEYARKDGEPPQVALAISEQYFPSPSSLPGVVVALADRLDTLTGLFAVGVTPSATRDPFGLRRAALGVVQPLIDHKASVDLMSLIRSSAIMQPLEVADDICEQVFEFIKGRLRVLFLDMNYAYDVVDAVLAEQAHDPYKALLAIQQLVAWVDREDWKVILTGYSRCVRITRDQKEIFELHPDKLQEDAEKQLYDVLLVAEKAVRTQGSADDFLSSFLPMLPTVNKFFDDVMVMVEDRDARQNRLALLQRITHLADGVADLSLLEGF
ncbi:MAG: glycine--tRNA ligase subunit beta [Anaerolineales bacterium]